MVISIEVKGINKTKMFLSKKSRQINTSIQKGISNSTFHIQNEVKESIAGRKSEPTSVDTGDFLRSVDTQILVNQGTIFSRIPYAKFLEFSPNIKAGPRRHFGNTAFREKSKIRDIINNEIKKVTII